LPEGFPQAYPCKLYLAQIINCPTFANGNEKEEGNGSRSLFICIILPLISFRFMEKKDINELIHSLLTGILSDMPDVYLVQVKIKPVNNFKVFVDTDQGISIDRCISINRKLYKAIEEKAIFPEGDFSLEVSSPGVGEPILLTRQYVKNIGRYLAVTLKDETKIEGKLTEATEDGIVLEEIKGKGKKQETILHSLLFEDIKKAVVEIKF
jgi:ribosome maturation factor RimP